MSSRSCLLWAAPLLASCVIWNGVGTPVVTELDTETTADAGTTDDQTTTDAGVVDGGFEDAGVTDGGADAGADGGIAGSINGVGLVVADSAAMDSSSSGLNTGGAGDAFVLLGSFSGVCQALTEGYAPSGGTWLAFYLVADDGQGEAVPATPGTYNIASTLNVASALVAKAEFYQDNEYCGSTLNVSATSGTITVSSIDTAGGGGVQGAFDLTFGSDTIAGNFNAAGCAGEVMSFSGFDWTTQVSCL
jgi:hypothetical protein